MNVKDIDPEQTGPPDTLTELRFKTLLYSFLVRYPAYHHHLIDILTGIFTPLQDKLEQTLGFNIKDALTLAEGIESFVGQRLIERRNEAKEFVSKLRKAVKVYRRKRRKAEDISLEVLKQLANMRPSESALTIRNMMISWIFFGFGETLSFTSQDLMNETGVSIEIVESFLKKMSLEFESIVS